MSELKQTVNRTLCEMQPVESLEQSSWTFRDHKHDFVWRPILNVETLQLLSESLIKDSKLGPSQKVWPVFGIVGPTNAGKSKITQLLKWLLDDVDPLLDGPAINGEGTDEEVLKQSQTGDINFYWARCGDDNNYPTIGLLDSEGQFAAGRPAEVTRKEKAQIDEIKQIGDVERLDKSEVYLNDHKGRQKAVNEIYPRLIYSTCNLVMYVTQQSLKTVEAIKNIVEFSQNGSRAVKGVSKPHLILIQNMASQQDLATWSIENANHEFRKNFAHTRESPQSDTYLDILGENFASFEVALIEECYGQNEEGVTCPYNWDYPLPIFESDRVKHLLTLLNTKALQIIADVEKQAFLVPVISWFSTFEKTVNVLSQVIDSVIDLDEIRNVTAAQASDHHVRNALSMFNQALSGLNTGKQISITSFHKMRLRGVHYLAHLVARELCAQSLKRTVSEEQDETRLSEASQKFAEESFSYFWELTKGRRPCLAVLNRFLGAIKIPCGTEFRTHDCHFQPNSNNLMVNNKWEGKFEMHYNYLVNDDDSIPIPLRSKLLSISTCYEEPHTKPSQRKRSFVHYVQHLFMSGLKLAGTTRWDPAWSFQSCEPYIQSITWLRADVGCWRLQKLENLHGCHICGSSEQTVQQSCGCLACINCRKYSESTHGLRCPIHQKSFGLNSSHGISKHLTESPPATHGIRVLSLDSGALRGISTARILLELERQVLELTKCHFLLRDLFDVLVGTGSGGAIAIAASTGARMTLILQEYQMMALSIYVSRWFQSNYFEHAVKTFLTRITQDGAAENSVVHPYPIWATTYMKEIAPHSPLQLLSLTNHNSNAGQRESIESGLGTSRFGRCSFSGSLRTDATYLVPSPCAHAVHFARKSYPKSPRQQIQGYTVENNVGCFERIDFVCSIGSGMSNGTGDDAKLCTDLYQSKLTCRTAKEIHTDMEAMLRSCQTKYFRLNAHFDKQLPFVNGRPENAEEIDAQTTKYLEQAEPKKVLQSMARQAIAGLFHFHISLHGDSCHVDVLCRIGLTEANCVSLAECCHFDFQISGRHKDSQYSIPVSIYKFADLEPHETEMETGDADDSVSVSTRSSSTIADERGHTPSDERGGSQARTVFSRAIFKTFRKDNISQFQRWIISGFLVIADERFPISGSPTLLEKQIN